MLLSCILRCLPAQIEEQGQRDFKQNVMVSLRGTTVSLQCIVKRINHTYVSPYFDRADFLHLMYFVSASDTQQNIPSFLMEVQYIRKRGGSFYVYVSEGM